MAKKNVPKQPKSAFQPSLRKQPRGAIFVEDQPLGWRFSAADTGGRWAWANLVGEPFFRVVSRLAQFERMTLVEILRTGSHEVDIEGICKEARDRLTEIKRDDTEKLFSVRIDATCRVWCVRDLNMMNVLWWDPDHSVWPVEKKNT